jgi:AcrR family transcriptional regulator
MEEHIKSTKAQRTKAKVLQSALDLMREKGYTNTTIREVCSTAGVSVGTFYSYFNSKEDVFSDIFKVADDYFCKTVSHKLKGNSTLQRVVDYFRYYAQLNYDSGIETMKILYNSDNTWFVKSRPMQDVLVEVLREGQDKGDIISDISAEDITIFLFIIARGCCYSWCISDGAYDLEAQLTDYISRALSTYEIKK